MTIVDRVFNWVIYLTETGNYRAYNPETKESLTHADKDFLISLLQRISKEA